MSRPVDRSMLTPGLFDLAGKTALVTGGSRGIGAMIARGYVEAGVRTYIAARGSGELAQTAEALCSVGECIAIEADLSTSSGIAQLAAHVRDREPALHILVNNAGATWGAPVDHFPDAAWDKVMALNVKAMFFLTRDLLPALRAAASPLDPARIINVGSIHALRASGMDNFAYTASKAAVLRLTEHLAASLSRDRICVNTLAPGLFSSRMTAFLLGDESDEAALAQGIPLGRIGQPGDAAGTAIYLASRASAFMTGACVTLDGGTVAAS